MNKRLGGIRVVFGIFGASFVVTLSGCLDSPEPPPVAKNGPPTQTGPAQPGPGNADAAQQSADAAVPPEQAATWLTVDVPPIVEGQMSPPIKLSDPQLTANEFGQEMLSVNYERPAVVRTLAADASLVLLPASGGRATVYVNPGILVQPQNAGKLTGITQNLLDHRGRIHGGMRVYLETHAASINGRGKPERASDVIWLGADEQLAAAVRQGPPPKVADGAGIAEPPLKPVPEGRIDKGTPLWMRCGDRWTRGNALEDSEKDQVRLLIYLVRRDKPFMPWAGDFKRDDLRIEQAALGEFRRDPKSFRDLADANDRKLARQGVPNKLEPVDPANLKVGTPVLDFWNGMLDGCRTTGEVKDGNVPIQRVGLDNAKMTKPAAGLFLDPFGKPAD